LLLGSDGPFKSRVSAHCSCWFGPLRKQSGHLRSASEYIIWMDTFFTKNEENLRAKHLEGGPWKGEPEASGSLASPQTRHWVWAL